MTLATTRAVALVGVRGHLVEVEADLSPGVPSFVLVGLPDASLNESRDRVRAAMVNSDQDWPPTTRRLTVNLSPASLPKRGSSFDLAIALAVLAADQVRAAGASVADAVLLGELGLDGRVRPVRGVLPGRARRVGGRASSAWWCRPPTPPRLRLVPGMRVTGVRSLAQLIALARGEPVPGARGGHECRRRGRRLAPTRPTTRRASTWPTCWARPTPRAMIEVAAAGGHHLLMVGPPGAGKTMLAERLPGLLPPLDRDGGHRRDGRPLGGRHAAVGVAAGDPAAVPGAAPHGVGGGDRRWRLDARASRCRLAGPPRGAVHGRGARVRARACSTRCASRSSRARSACRGWPPRCASRRGSSSCWPPTRARAGMAVVRGRDCTCSPMAKLRYFGRLSGPLLDRVDLRREMRPRDPTRAAGRSRAGGDHGGRRRSGARCPGADDRPAVRHTLAGQRGGAGPRHAARLAAALGRRRRGRARARPWQPHRSRRRPGAAGGVDDRRPGGPRPARRRTRCAMALRYRGVERSAA